jgi:hypothetical protein
MPSLLVWVVVALGGVVSDEAKMLPLVDATPRDPIGPWAWDTIPYFVHCSNVTGTLANAQQNFVRHQHSSPLCRTHHTHTLSFGLVSTSSINRQWAKCSNTAGRVPASILSSCRRIRRVLVARCGGGVVGVSAGMTACARLSHDLVTSGRRMHSCSRSQCASTIRHTRYHATARDRSHQSKSAQRNNLCPLL